MTEYQVHELQRLPGVGDERIEGVIAKTPSGFLAALKRYRACSDGGDHGSVIVYRDDAGAFRCMFMRWKEIEEEQTFTSKSKVREWLKIWLPVQHEAAK